MGRKVKTDVCWSEVKRRKTWSLRVQTSCIS